MMDTSHVRSCSQPPVPGVSLQGTSMSKIAGSINTNRNCTIEITNHLTVPLEAPEYFCFSGYCHNEFPPMITTRFKEVVAFSKTSDIPRGAVGVFTYRIGQTNLQVAVMFAVPFDYNLSSNWFAVGFIPVDINASDNLFQEMYYSDEWDNQPEKKREKASRGVLLTVEYENLRVTASMTDESRAEMKVVVTSSDFDATICAAAPNNCLQEDVPVVWNFSKVWH